MYISRIVSYYFQNKCTGILDMYRIWYMYCMWYTYRICIS